jgi:hypothetical protein
MANGEWVTRGRARDAREAERERLKRLRIEWADKLWLAENHPCDDSVLAWLSENRSEASKIGSHRWNLETLPKLEAAQARMRQEQQFSELIGWAAKHPATVTVERVVEQIPQVFPQNQETKRAPRKDAGKARKRPRQSVV